jgi:TPR repeat protein
MYFNGQDVIQDLSRAKALFGQACDNGSQSGCNNNKILNE